MVKSNVEKTAAERSDYSSLYRGVRKRKWGKYVSEIRLPNSRQRIWLGSYDSAVKAARAFDAAMFCLRGSGAKFNFPNDPPDIAGGRSMTHSQIKAAATRFANSGQPDNEYSGWSVTETPSSSEGAAVLLPMESPTRQIYRDYDSKELFLDLFSKTGSGYSMSPCFYDFGGDFYVPELTNFDYEEENMDGLIRQDSFLWNF